MSLVLENDPATQRILTEGRAGQPDETPTAPRRGSVTAQIEEIFFTSYLKYFQNAEERRRWDMERDIPWEKVTTTVSDLTADIVESFSAVEMYLPDYTHRIMQLIRQSRGRAWFQANWGYEESKHSMVLEEWLIRSGKRTEEQVREFENQLLGAEWQLPFDSPRQMIIYTMIQEMATGLNYTNLRRRAESEGDEALARTLRWVSADESAHYNFFRKAVKAYLALEPDETIADVKFVFDHFAMPAHALIPGWQKRGEDIEAAGIYGPKMYLAKIRRPILEDLGISRQQLKNAGLPGQEADALADRAEEKVADAERASRAVSVFGPLSPLALTPPNRRRIIPLT
jgi:acyl-[acyl-carrier-protein] desaturase